MAPANRGVAHFAMDARVTLFTVQAFAAGIVAVVAHSPKFASGIWPGRSSWLATRWKMRRCI
jgi:hypothetical protein